MLPGDGSLIAHEEAPVTEPCGLSAARLHRFLMAYADCSPTRSMRAASTSATTSRFCDAVRSSRRTIRGCSPHRFWAPSWPARTFVGSLAADTKTHGPPPSPCRLSAGRAGSSGRASSLPGGPGVIQLLTTLAASVRPPQGHCTPGTGAIAGARARTRRSNVPTGRPARPHLETGASSRPAVDPQPCCVQLSQSAASDGSPSGPLSCLAA